MEPVKDCSKCGETKALGDFHRQASNEDGRKNICKQCICAHARNYHHVRKKIDPDYVERARIKARHHYWLDPEARRRAAKQWRSDNPEMFKQGLRRWYQENKDKAQEDGKARYQKNKDYINKRNAAWQSANREKMSAYSLQWHHDNKRKKHIAVRLAMRRMLQHFLTRTKQGKSGQSRDSVLGYTPEMLRDRMSCQFRLGMSWENHGAWHIDHKIPISYFIAKGEVRPHIVNALSNLQPLWANENQRKSDRWDGVSSGSEWHIQ